MDRRGRAACGWDLPLRDHPHRPGAAHLCSRCNPEAAELSGISVKRITFMVFGSMGMLSTLSGILFASRLQSATTTAGTLFERDTIAAAYVDGVSAAGGIGRVTGSIIEILVITSLTSGRSLMGVGIAYQYIVRGVVLAAAVIFDVATRRAAR